MNKKTLITSAIVGILAVGTALGFTAVQAAEQKVDNPRNGLIEKIATRFNLNQNDVKQVFDEHKTEMMAQHEEQFKTRVSDAVSKGTLTQAQADAIIAKKAELEANRPNFEGKSQAEIRDLMKTQMDDLKKWAEDNNIPPQFRFFQGPLMGKAHGHFKGGMFRHQGDKLENPTTK